MALVVTIVVLIILATISISAVFSDNGIIKQAEKARDMTANSTKYEEEQMKQLTDELANAGDVVSKPSTWTSDKVTPISDGSGNAVPLPDGFYYIGGDRSTGLVISDKQGDTLDASGTSMGNQFVWIPVDNEEALTRTNFDSSGNPTTDFPITGISVKSCSEPCQEGYSDGNGTDERREYGEMLTHVLAHGGFYIGRFEAGADSDKLDFDAFVQAISSRKIVSKRNVCPIVSIPWAAGQDDIDSDVVLESTESDDSPVVTKGVVDLSKNMYLHSPSVVSTLAYGCQWDSMCRYLGDCQSVSQKKESPGLTGSDQNDVSRNIYDLSGNCIEWTMESHLSDSGHYDTRVLRGGSWSFPYPVYNRSHGFISQVQGNDIGFRVALYIKGEPPV